MLVNFSSTGLAVAGLYPHLKEVCMGFDRWSRESMQDLKIRNALQGAQAGRIKEFAFIREMMDADGQFRSKYDRQDVDSMCRKLNILSQDLQEWRIQYDALPK